MIDEFARIKDSARDEGERRLAALVSKLFALNRIEDVKKLAEDAEYRKQLMKEFAIC